jgi:pimeloyl-ACP methyl ester carboxylesterase
MTSEVTPLQLHDGRRLDVYVHGDPDGPAGTVLYHHGSPSSGLIPPSWDAQSAAAGVRLISFSRAGYGSSTRREGRSVADNVTDAVEVLDAMGVPRAWVLGWSGGGPHAIACAGMAPDRFPGAATIGGVAPYPAEGIDWFEGMGPENIEEFKGVLADPGYSVRSAERDWPKYRDVTGPELADALGGLIDHVDRGSLTGEFAESTAAATREGLRESYWGWVDDDWAFARKPWGFDLGAITAPIHVWQGGHDKMVPFGHGGWLCDHIPTACRHLDPEEGHLTLALDAFPRILDELIAAD